MSRTRRFFGGLASGYAHQTIATVVGLWLTAFLLTRLGEHEYGLWLLVAQLLGYLALLDLGVVALLPRETAYATGRAGGVAAATDLPAIVGRTARLVLWQTPIVALAGLMLWFYLPATWDALRPPLGLVLAAFVVLFPLRILHATLRGLQDLAFLGMAHTATWLAGTAVAVALVVAGFGLYGLAIGWVVGQGLVPLVAWIRLRRRFPQALPRAISKSKTGSPARMLKRGAWVSVSQVSHVLFSSTDVIIVGAMWGPAAVVPYVITGKLAAVLANQPQLLMQAAEPGLSEIKTGENRERAIQVSAALTEAMLIFGGVLVCVVLAVNEGFIGWWVGSEQWGGLVLTALILGRVMLSHWNLTIATSLFSFGHERRLALTALASGVVTVGTSLVLVARVGVIGAPLGAILGVALVGLPANLVGLSREIGVSVGRLVGAHGQWLWRFALVVGIAIAIATQWTPPTLPSLVVAAAAVAVPYGLLMVRRLQHPPLSIYAHPKLKAFLTRWSS
ncbi:MAG: oligosaccharide flippase family protein [Gemmatimonadetes bacterium]|nr:oligosaccharide flippase family protein [Gemmatimonadota bacterium]